MFDKLLNEKNRYILVNIIFTLILITFVLLLIVILKESAINVFATVFTKIGNTPALSILLIIFTGVFIGYVIHRIVNQKLVIKGSLIYLSTIINTIQIFYFDKVKYYFSRLTVDKVLFIKKFIFIFCYLILIVLTIYSICVITKIIWGFLRKKIVDFDPPKINKSELQQAIGLYFLDFEYNKNLSYYVTYEGNGKVIKEDISSNKLLCLVGELLPDVDYTIRLHCLANHKTKFIALESNEVVKLQLNRKPTDLQERIAYYYHYSPSLVECYISLLQVFDKMFKRLLINSPEVINKRLNILSNTCNNEI